MDDIYYEIGLVLNKELYDEQKIPYEVYLKVERELLKKMHK